VDNSNQTPPSLPSPPPSVSPYGIPDYARKKADRDRQHIEAVLSSLGLKMVRGTVVETDAANSQIRVRRVTAGSLGVDDEMFFPVRGGAMPEVGDFVFGFESSGGPVFLGNIGGSGTSQAVGAFSAAHAADQPDIQNNTFTKVDYDSEDYDVSGWYNPNNSRYTPQQAGIYSFNALILITPEVDASSVQLALY